MQPTIGTNWRSQRRAGKILVKIQSACFDMKNRIEVWSEHRQTDVSIHPQISRTSIKLIRTLSEQSAIPDLLVLPAKREMQPLLTDSSASK